MSILRAAVLAATIVTAGNASAGLNDAFSNAFSDATVQTGGAGTFELNGRTLHQGGYVRIRIPTAPAPNPIRVQPPTIRGGCNGFDIYGGSFSYITADEFLDWLNAVIENSGALASYMFITYLQEQCSVCSEVMQSLYAMQDLMNMTMQDSCSTATAMVDGLQGVITGDDTPSWDAYKEGVKKSAINFSDQVEATYDDAVQALRSGEESVKNLASSAVPNEKDRIKTLYGGNLVYWLIEDTDALSAFRSFLNNSTLTKEQLYVYLVAMVGNYVSFVDETVSDGTQTTRVGDYRSTVSITDFIEGTYNDLVLPADCAAAGAGSYCRDPGNLVFKDGFAEVTPFADTFTCAMEGTKMDGSTCGSDGLLVKLGKDKDSVPAITTAEKDFIMTFKPGINFGAMLNTLSSSDTAMSVMYDCFKESLLEDFAYVHMRWTHELVKKQLEGLDMGDGQGKDAKSAFSKMIVDRMVELEKQYRELRENVQQESNCQADQVKSFLDLKEFSKIGVN